MIEFNATFIVCMISFIVFMFIMNSIFYRPILNMIRKRDEYINKNYNDANEFNQKAGEYTDRYNSGLNKAKEDGRKQSAQDLDKIQKSSFDKIRLEKDNSKQKIQEKKELLNSDKETLKNSISSNIEQDLVSAVTSKIINGN